MKFLLAGSLLLVLQGIPPLVGPLVPDSNSTVTGVVRRADSGQPMPDVLVAAVAVADSAERALSRGSTTDRNGRFWLRNVPPGNYTVVVQREGFFSAAGQSDSGIQMGPSVTTWEGQTADVGTLDLIPGATISGRISGTDGLPLASATVEALRPSYTRGRLTLTPVKSTLTDDLGEYRLFWLQPGAYYVRGQYRASTADRPETFGRVFFPGIQTEDAAPSVVVGAGGEISGIDIRLPTTPVRGFTLSGRVAADDTSEVSVTAVYMVPRDRRILLSEDTADLFPNRAAETSDGRFEIHNVPPAAYDLFPVVRDGDGRVRTPRIAIDVEDRNVEEILVNLDPPVKVQGRITWDEAPGQLLVKTVIMLRPLDAIPDVGRTDFEVDPDPETGDFALSVPPGRYAVVPASALLASDAFIADVKQEETSVFDSGLAVDKESGPFEVEMKAQGGTVYGTVNDPTRLRPVPYAVVVLVPEPARRRNAALYRQEKSGADGTFSFIGIAPGTYKLFAWRSAPPGAWENAAFLERFEDRGMPVTVDVALPPTVQLNLIP